MRAAAPTRSGAVVRNGASIAFDVYERDGPTILLMPTWQILHSRHWKFQIPYLCRLPPAFGISARSPPALRWHSSDTAEPDGPTGVGGHHTPQNTQTLRDVTVIPPA